MAQFGSQQMHSLTPNGDALTQRPQSQNDQSNASQRGPQPKPHNGAPDVKPRLTKEQHDILEAHFLQQHKPSTNTKKGFAESLGVPLDKINNWFQNRRAKVKQDMKKQMNQYNMSIGVYGPPPMGTSPFSQSSEQPQNQHLQPMTQDYYSNITANADVSPTCHPLQGMDAPSTLELGSQMPLHPPFDLHSLRSIPEADRNTYHPDTLMQSFMAATAGASFMQNQASSLPQDTPSFSYDPSNVQNAFQPNLGYSVSTPLQHEPLPSHDTFGVFPDFSTYNCSSLDAPSANAADAQNSAGSISSAPSPFSGNQSNVAAASASGPNASSVTSIASMYSGWTEDPRLDTKVPSTNVTNEFEESFDLPYNLPQASVSDRALPFWSNTPQGISRADLYQHTNASAQAVLASPGQSTDRRTSAGLSDFEPPHPFGEDGYSRRNSSTSNLANNIEAINIQNSQTPDDFTQTNSSSIAARRQKRPTALNSSTLRSSSYSGGMPSPGGNSDHSLRRIRSSGIPNAGGRVQKSTPGSAQRSPMTTTFADAAASPKFARAFSTSSTTTAGQSGSLAPLTPQTPNGLPYNSWTNNTGGIRNHSTMPEHSSPESLNVNWPAEPQAAGLSNGTSPPCTPLDLTQLNPAQSTEDLYRDTPPQSAPATQQSFPGAAFMQAPHHVRNGFHSTSDLTIVQPKPSHFRRPSLPDPNQPQLNDSQMQFPTQFTDFYDHKFNDLSLSGIHHNVPFAPPAVMPEFLMHDFNGTSPGGAGSGMLMRRAVEPQQKSYIFANQGPGDFRS